jgi:hypothetical protein
MTTFREKTLDMLAHAEDQLLQIECSPHPARPETEQKWRHRIGILKILLACDKAYNK